MKQLKRYIGLILIGLMILNSTIYAQEVASPEAEYLFALGLVKGSGVSFDLDKTLSRAEAAVMIVRLRGDEALLESTTYAHPFVDVPMWATGYVGYLYANGLTNGKTETLFGSNDPVSMEQFVTFLLRVLNYDDSKGDFRWDQSLAKAKEIGMISSTTKSTSGATFLRRDMMTLTYKALSTTLKNQKVSLQNNLTYSGALPDNIEEAKRIMALDTFTMTSKPSSLTQLRQNVEKMIYDMKDSYTFDMSLMKTADISSLISEAKANMNQVPMYSSILKAYKISKRGTTLIITLDYNITKTQLDQSKIKAKQIVQKIINLGMNDFEKELAIHDYIVNNVVYDSSKVLNDSVYTIYGALIKEKAVCNGYAEAFEYLAFLAGLNSTIVLGEATSQGVTIGHAWNLIKIDGAYYHIDTTWDDPVTSDGTNRLTYDYFNVTDEVLKKDHSWDQSSYPKSFGTKYNYYTYNKMEVAGLENLKNYLQNEFNRGTEIIDVKVTGVAMTMTNLKNVLDACYGFSRISYKVNTTTNVVTIVKIQ